ncbi:acyltransferase [Winslowiella toletana]|uniref:acyltransferase n=1 Tax=Winslowiella toletana TaxID=92490 RepID=UPI0028BD864D|nr:acyltransferase [Winslowiella toletana]WNN42971.1 acyltransferase [Winslowiella toletana]
MIDFNKRQQWIDITRGLSILFVISFHLLSGTEYLNLVENVPGYIYFSRAIGFLNSTVAPIRMELLMLLSGMLVSRGLQKGIEKYHKGKIKSILYPYLIWSLVMLVLMSARGLVSGEKDIHDVVVYFFKIIIGVPSVTWFLYWVFVFFMIQPWTRNFNPLLVLPVVLALSFILAEVEPLLISDGLSAGVSFSTACYCYAFFFLGDYIIKSGVDLAEVVRNKYLIALSLFSLITLSFIMNSTSLNHTNIALFPLAVLSLVTIAIIAQMLEKLKVGKVFAFIGVNSIFFYLMHIPVFMIIKRTVPLLNFSEAATAITIWIAVLLVPYIAVKLRDKKFIRIFFEYRWA